MHGLNQQYYSARWLDNVRMQFTSMDQLAEKNNSISSYAYCAGNAVKYIDPNGQDIQKVDSDGNIAYHEEYKSQYLIQKVSDVAGNDDSNRVINEKWH